MLVLRYRAGCYIRKFFREWDNFEKLRQNQSIETKYNSKCMSELEFSEDEMCETRGSIFIYRYTGL